MTTRNLRPLQRTIGAFAVLPVLSGLGEALLGPRAVPGGSPAVGGAVRLLSWRQHGRPHPAIVAATVGETVLVPIIIAWRRRLQNSPT